MTDPLHDFVRTRSADAFRLIVETHADSVYSQCLRQLRDPLLAEEVTQTVFISVAKKARSIRSNAVLAGWLFNAARYGCANVRRGENRRRRWEREAMRMRLETIEPNTADSDDSMQRAECLLDDALAKLSGADRDAILLRYFQKQSLRDVGLKMGISEDAAKQRVSRAVEKLRTWFTGQGLAAPSVMIGGWLEAAVKPAPPGLIGTISQAKLPIEAKMQWRWMSWKIAASMVVAVLGTGGVMAVIALADGNNLKVAPSTQSVANTETPATTAPTTAPTVRPAVVSITVRALIDGRSQLRFKGGTAQWQNFDYAAPGKHEGRNEPTTINGIEWNPKWEDSDMNAEVRVEKSMSDTFDRLDPALPAAPMDVTVQKIRCRENASIVQQPGAANEFTTILEFDDHETGGSDWYEVKLTFTPTQVK